MRRIITVGLITLAFFAVRLVTADREFVAETIPWMADQTGVVLPEWYLDHPWLPAGLNGDGMVFTTQVVDPFGRDGYATRMTTAGYRFTRIGYPLAAKAVTFGIDDLAPVGLFIVSTCGVGLCAWMADRMRAHWGPWAWLLVANPAVLLGYLYGSAEPLGIGLAALALTRGAGWAAFMATVRPDLLVVLTRRPKAFLVASGTAGLVWVTALSLFGSVRAGHNLTFPLIGYLETSSSAVWVLAAIAGLVVAVGI